VTQLLTQINDEEAVALLHQLSQLTEACPGIAKEIETLMNELIDQHPSITLDDWITQNNPMYLMNKGNQAEKRQKEIRLALDKTLSEPTDGENFRAKFEITDFGLHVLIHGMAKKLNMIIRLAGVNKEETVPKDTEENLRGLVRYLNLVDNPRHGMFLGTIVDRIDLRRAGGLDQPASKTETAEARSPRRSKL
jgi:hypothetical protein